MYDLLVLGSGVAGLSTALRAASKGMQALVLTKGELAMSATRYAQGGVAAALEAPDSADLHQADTMIAGAGLCDPDAVRILVTEGPARVRELGALGAQFDAVEGSPGLWRLAREGGHSLARVVHAGGDATGAEIERALATETERVGIEVREGWLAIDLLIEHDRCVGVLALDAHGQVHNVRASDTVLATGGAGQCFAVTTNPELSTGDGIALALRAGVACSDLEFVQFHPTALHVPRMPRPLLSEALRGEGAVLRDEQGIAFMEGRHELRDLAPRDVVSRAIAERLREQGVDHVWLDATMIPDFDVRFPTIFGACRSADLDPRVDWLPVAPAAHYLCGGVLTDLDGATSTPRLWACGETADAGVHGANRLASNSLLDGLVFGARVVDAIAAGKVQTDETGAQAGVSSAVGLGAPDPDVDLLPRPEPIAALDVRDALQRVMAREVGVVRDAEGLLVAEQTLEDLARLGNELPARSAASYEARNLLRVARAIVANATARAESRGSHTRADHRKSNDAMLGRFVLAGSNAPQFVPSAVLVEGRP
jgi:L-aspartate oxidase